MKSGDGDPHLAFRALGVTAAALLGVSAARGLTQMVAGFQSETLLVAVGGSPAADRGAR